MSHLAATMRKIADEEAAPAPAPALAESVAEVLKEEGAEDIALEQLPGIGTTVSFRLRGAEYRNGAQDFAAIVTRVHHARGLIDIVVVLGADDVMEQREVPRRTADGDWGWSPTENGTLELAVALQKLRSDFEAFKIELAAVIFGQFPKASESIYDVLQEMDNRLSLLAPTTTKTEKRRRRSKG